MGFHDLGVQINVILDHSEGQYRELEKFRIGVPLPIRVNKIFEQFWWWATRATIVAFTCTFFELFNVPVFWPILVMYFIMLFIITMKRQLKHMIKHKYVPWTAGKKKFQGKDDKGDVSFCSHIGTFLNFLGVSKCTTVPHLTNFIFR